MGKRLFRSKLRYYFVIAFAFFFVCVHIGLGEIRSLETATTWLKRLPAPDRILLNPAQINQLNQSIQQNIPEVADVFNVPSQASLPQLRVIFQDALNKYRSQVYYDDQGNQRNVSFFENLAQEIQVPTLERSPSVQWGVVTQRTSVRALPTHEVCLKDPTDTAFDQLQYTSLSPGEPMAIYWRTQNRQWAFVQSRFYQGWVSVRDIAIGRNKEEVRQFAQQEPFGVVTGTEVSVYADPQQQRRILDFEMGNRLAGLQRYERGWKVLVPRQRNGWLVFETGFLKQDADVRQGYLPMTQGHILLQAFKLLGQPYSWGGQWHGDDCSGYLVKLFRTFGLSLPRDSYQQAQVGNILQQFSPILSVEAKKNLVSTQAVPLVTFFQLKGHIMLYLGQSQGQHYVIHAPWKEWEWTPQGERQVSVARMTISKMNTGDKTSAGSYWQQLISINKLIQKRNL